MRRSQDILRREYRLRFLACLAGTLLTAVLAFRLWPASPPAPPPPEASSTPSQERLMLRESIPQTRQQGVQQDKAPPPPAPLPPIARPEPVEQEEVALDFFENKLPVERPPANEGGSAPAPATTGPRPVRYVEPEYTRAAKKRQIRASLQIQVIINERGRVEKARVLKRFLHDKESNRRRVVDVIGYGVEEAALAAARRWRFRPARRGQEPISSTMTLTFSFGV